MKSFTSTIIHHTIINPPDQNQYQPTGNQNQNQTHRKSKSKSTHRKIKTKIISPEIKIKINPQENKNKNQLTVNLLRRRPMVSTEIPKTSHGFHRPVAGAPPIPLEDSFLGPVESQKRKAAM
jgi:hypothetical protein